ncbi:hypothetical protein M501DRAFT_1006398 [Patellaria atrata CBS 101060]|uniref:tRNA (adenine(58)-N(1))-methyltransferase catalytic subunit TRM61 n=1 Tax=Patellaria atrata CBS 101060 TaxID=1346257 RepID=A0A9P4VNN0_9PEZI|nr:hypothetical protein M501DRAFT_1006398 [Patellaria atrata CBS 101060]
MQQVLSVFVGHFARSSKGSSLRLIVYGQCLRRFSAESTFSAIGRRITNRARNSEGDIVLLKYKLDATDGGILTKPLKASKTIQTHRGIISHDSIINKRIRDVVTSNKGAVYRIHKPTLAEYVRLTPRLVTPIYPGDANLIVSLLDIHVDPPTDLNTGEPCLEILEAGTGHGALTLHLARAVHAANPPLPPAASRDTLEYNSPMSASDSPEIKLVDDAKNDVERHIAEGKLLETWKQDRRAVIHTLDVSEKYSQHACKIVGGFRRGMYRRNVEFNVGDVSEWVEEQFLRRQDLSPFLTHAFLDLPSAESHLKSVSEAVRIDGFVAVFAPSISQISECVELIRRKKLPLAMDQVVELGSSVNARQWDVRAVRPRAAMNKEAEKKTFTSVEDDTANHSDSEAPSLNPKPASGETNRDENWSMVCRPKVGERIVGGGFLALWRKMREAPIDGPVAAIPEPEEKIQTTVS